MTRGVMSSSSGLNVLGDQTCRTRHPSHLSFRQKLPKCVGRQLAQSRGLLMFHLSAITPSSVLRISHMPFLIVRLQNTSVSVSATPKYQHISFRVGDHRGPPSLTALESVSVHAVSGVSWRLESCLLQLIVGVLQGHFQCQQFNSSGVSAFCLICHYIYRKHSVHVLILSRRRLLTPVQY